MYQVGLGERFNPTTAKKRRSLNSTLAPMAPTVETDTKLALPISSKFENQPKHKEGN